jgi:hypothetical protein
MSDTFVESEAADVGTENLRGGGAAGADGGKEGARRGSGGGCSAGAGALGPGMGTAHVGTSMYGGRVDI